MISAVPALASLLTLSAAETWAIVDVDTGDGMMGLGAQVTRQLLETASAQKLTVLGPDQLRGTLSADKYAGLKKCRDSTACVAQSLAGTPVARVVTGSLTRDEKNYLLKLWHHDVRSMQIVCDVDRSILIASRRLQKDVEQAVPGLLRGEREARGTLTIEANLATAQITINGDFVGTPPSTVTLKPGKYEVKLEKAKYLPITRLVDVEANQTKTETFKLLLIPGQEADVDPVAKLQPADPSGGGGVRLSALTWISGGLAVASGTVATIFGLLANGQETSLIMGLDAATGVYQGTRAQALEQNRNATVANVAFVTLGVAAIATVVFLIVDLVSGSGTGGTP